VQFICNYSGGVMDFVDFDDGGVSCFDSLLLSCLLCTVLLA
jgi:hypothetical protein